MSRLKFLYLNKFRSFPLTKCRSYQRNNNTLVLGIAGLDKPVGIVSPQRCGCDLAARRGTTQRCQPFCFGGPPGSSARAAIGPRSPGSNPTHSKTLNNIPGCILLFHIRPLIFNVKCFHIWHML